MLRALLPLLLLPFFQEKDPDYGPLSKKCGTQIDWILDPYKLEDKGPGADKTVPADRAALLADAQKKATAANRIILWYVFRIEGPHMYRAQLPDNYMMQVVWNDPDIVDLVKRKFIPIKMCSDAKLGKLVAPDVVEPAIVLMGPDGAVLHKIERIRTFNADWVLSTLVSVLHKNEKYNAAADKPAEPVALAEEHLKGGDYEKARPLLEANIADPKAAYLLAQLHRRQRKPDDAIAALEKAKGPAIGVERGLVLLRQRKLDEAFKAFEEAGKAKSDRAAEAKYFAALIDFLKARDTAALQKWTRLVREAPNTPWGWRAAANLAKSGDTTAEGAAVHGYDDPFWSGGETAEAPEGTLWKRKPEEIDEVARRAVEFLLQSQRENGSWSDTRYAYWDGPHILPNVRMSISCAAAAALLEFRDVDPKRIDASLAKAEKYMLDEANMARGKNEECYADAYRIQYWSRKYGTKDAKKPLCQKAMIDALNGLAKSQKANGAWSHEYPNPFCTAAVMVALMRASQCKLEIPGRMVSQAAESIKSCRGADGGYKYDNGRGAPSGVKDSMARMPLCEMALFIGRIGTVEAVETSMKNFWDHLDKLERIRKCDFHTDGELGGFFFFHGLFHTSEAVQLVLKDPARAPHQAKLLEHLLKMEEIDGSFIDDHELGKSYGTAMALLTLKNAQGIKTPTK